uniref:Immunoglobulin subtype domain-containing protein n=1 Tax=Kryptolebias marmoratus TaxID=37003 RepID=A0A3Q3B931_KRYMA
MFLSPADSQRQILYQEYLERGHLRRKHHLPVEAGVTIPCLYEAKYRDNVKYLCKGYTWASCSYEIKTNTPQNSQIYSISDDKTQTIFTVTIKELADKNTYYWCIVEIDGGADVKEYFYLSETTGKINFLYQKKETTAITAFLDEKYLHNCLFVLLSFESWSFSLCSLSLRLKIQKQCEIFM